MKKEIQDQFDAAFDAHARNVEQSRQARVAKQAKAEEFVRAFNEYCTTTAKPAFERIGAYLLTKGLKTRIDQTGEKLGQDGRQESQTALAFRLLIGEEGRNYASHEQPALTLFCDKHRKQVTLHQSTMRPGAGGASGPLGDFKLEQLTEEFLQLKVLALVRDVLR